MLILHSKLAPCYPGDEYCNVDLEECPICILIEHAQHLMSLSTIHFGRQRVIASVQKKKSAVPSAIRREDVWCEAHIKMNGEVSNAHVADCMVEALSQIFGPERNGRVQAMGLGITPSQMSVYTHQSKRIHELDNHISVLSTKLDHLTNLFMQSAKRHLSSRIDRVDSNLDECKEPTVATKDEETKLVRIEENQNRWEGELLPL